MTTPIDPEIHRALDGELDPAALSPEARATLERLQTVAAWLGQTSARASLAPRVLAMIRRPVRSPLARVARWITDRQAVTVSLRPVYSLAGAIVLVVIILFHPTAPTPALGAEEGIAQFVARFPDAHSVAVVGSFNDWSAESTPLSDDDHDGVWNANVILPTGQHEYMFVVDGERWVVDPLAGRYVDDGFGQQNAIVIVRPGRR